MGLGNILKDLKDDLFTYRTVKVRGRGRTFRGLSLSLSLSLWEIRFPQRLGRLERAVFSFFLDGTISNGRGEVLFVLSRLCASIRRDLFLSLSLFLSFSFSLSLSLSLWVKC